MIRYKKLGYVELNVSDIDRSRKYYQDIVGLELVGNRSDGASLFRCDSEDAHSVVLNPNKAAGFKSAGWELEDDSQFENLHQRLRDAKVDYEELSPAECSLRNAAKVTRAVEPYCHATLEFFLPADNPIGPFVPTHTKIQRLGHVIWTTPRHKELIAFFRDVLNFRESDIVGEATTFLRPFPSPFHHGIGVGHSNKPIFHHLNFMVSEIDDIGKAQNRMRKLDVPIVWGPGRHPASTSVFFYFLDPDGLTLEYSFGMEEFPEVDPREPRHLPMVPESTDTWDSVRDPRMGQTGIIEDGLIHLKC